MVLLLSRFYFQEDLSGITWAPTAALIFFTAPRYGAVRVISIFIADRTIRGCPR